MDRNEFLPVIFLLFLVVNVSGGSVAGKFRKLADAEPKEDSTATKIDPPPSPVSVGNQSEPNPIDPGKLGKEKSKDAPVPTTNSSKADSKGKQKEKNDDKASSELGTYGTCDGLLEKCTDPKKKMIACIQSFENGSKALIVQNEGENTLKVNLTVSDSVKDALEVLVIPKHQTRSMNILSTGSSKLVLNAGNKDCVFENHLISEGNFFQWLPHSELVTPIYGVYFLFLTALVVGAMWTCCKFRKRRHQGGVPYQELEMGLPESSPAVNVETAAGWDEGWDDDWDEDKAVKSPGGRYVGSISSNGLTTRSSNREGWENDWDD